MTQYKGKIVMSLIIILIKGALIGVANIIPGVSGGTMAVSMGVYDQLIKAITSLRRAFYQSLRILTPYILGAVLGIAALSFIIRFTLDRFPLQTAGLFIGLILGGIPALLVKSKIRLIRPCYAGLFIVSFALILAMALVSEPELQNSSFTFSIQSGLQLFAVGTIAAAAMIIPGVSGSLIMMLLGWYNTIILQISQFIEAVFTFNSEAITNGLLFFTLLGTGIVVGIIGVAKLIETLFRRAPQLTYSAILGLIAASPMAILLDLNRSAFTLANSLTALPAAAAGFLIAWLLSRQSASV